MMEEESDNSRTMIVIAVRVNVRFIVLHHLKQKIIYPQYLASVR